MASRSVFSKVFNYIKNYGKPDPKKPFCLGGVMIGTFVVASLTVLAFRFHVGYLCIFLIGEYKETYEYWKYQFERSKK